MVVGRGCVKFYHYKLGAGGMWLDSSHDQGGRKRGIQKGGAQKVSACLE